MLPAIASPSGKSSLYQSPNGGNYSTPSKGASPSVYTASRTSTATASVESRLRQVQTEQQNRMNRLLVLKNLGAGSHATLTQDSLARVEQLLGDTSPVASSKAGTVSTLSSMSISSSPQRARNMTVVERHAAGAAGAVEGMRNSTHVAGSQLPSLETLRGILFPPSPTSKQQLNSCASGGDEEDSKGPGDDEPAAFVAYDECGLLPPTKLLGDKALKRRAALDLVLQEMRAEHPQVAGALLSLSSLYDEFLKEIVRELNHSTPTTAYFHALSESACDVGTLTRKTQQQDETISELQAELALLREENSVLRSAGDALNTKTKKLSTVLKATTDQLKVYDDAQNISIAIQKHIEHLESMPARGEDGEEEDIGSDEGSVPKSVNSWLGSKTPNMLVGAQVAEQWQQQSQADKDTIMHLQSKVRSLEKRLEFVMVQALEDRRRRASSE